MRQALEGIDLSDMEFDLPCAIQGCEATASVMVYGDHSIFGCPGCGPCCEYHHAATVEYTRIKGGSIGRCRGCGGQRIETPSSYRMIRL